MTILEYKQHIAAGLPVEAGSPAHLFMHAMSQEAIRITMEINNRYHTPEELRALLSELWGIEVPESVGMFPPFNTDCGKNTEVGERTFINSGCKFQDQGGIRIGCDCLIGHNATLCTINHNLDPDHRGDMTFKPIVIEDKVWLGANVTNPARRHHWRGSHRCRRSCSDQGRCTPNRCGWCAGKGD